MRARGQRWCVVCVLTGAIALASAIQAQQSKSDQSSDAATRQYAVAVGFQNQKLYDSAIDEWKTFLRKHSNDERADKATHYLGICQLQAKQFDAAAATFASVEARYPKFELLDQTLLNHGSALYSIALKSKKPADFEKAERPFAKLVEQFPKTDFVGRALYYRGECLYQQEKYELAAAAYSQLLTTDAKNELAPDACYAMGICFEKLQQPGKAAEAFDRFAKAWPKHSLATEVSMRQAEMLFASKNYAEARGKFADVSKVADFSLADTAMLRQARCLYEINELKEAAATYWNVPRQFPKTKHYDAAVVAGAKCYYLLGEYQSCRSGLENVVKRDVPEAAEAAQWMARCLLKEKKPQDALTVLDAALAKHSKSPAYSQLALTRIDALYEIPARRAETAELYAKFAADNPKDEMAAQAQYMAALTALESGDNSVAKSASTRFLKAFPNDRLSADVQFISAEAHLLTKDYADAVPLYREFLQMHPQHASAGQAGIRLALALQLAKKYDEALLQVNAVVPQLTDANLKSEALVIAGRCYVATDKLEDAAKALEQSYVASPKRDQSDRTLVALADVCLKLNRNANAATALERVLTEFPSSPAAEEATFRLGEASYAASEFSKAEQHYRQTVTKWPAGDFAAPAAFGLGWAMFKQNKLEETVAAMNSLATKYSKSELSTKGLYLKGMAEFQLQKYDDAISDARRFLASKPSRKDASDARYLLGLSLAAKRDFANAAKEFEGILADDANYADADKVLYELGWAWQELGDANKSLATFDRLAKEQPKSPLAAESVFRVAESHYDAGRYDDASKHYAATLHKAGQSELGEKAAHKLGWSALKAEKFADADAAFQNQLKSFPKGPLAGDAMFLIGECQFREKQWRPALAQYAEVIAAKNPTYQALALFRSGECAAAAEMWDESLAFHQAVLKQFPDFELKSEARYGVAWAMQQRGQLDQATAQYELVTEETDSETAAKARFMIGECCFAEKKHDEAAKHFLKAAFAYNHEEWSAMAWFEAARCFEVLKDVDQAKNCYRQLIEKFPKHSKVADAKKRLGEL